MQCNKSNVTLKLGIYTFFFSALRQYPDHNSLSVMGSLRDSRNDGFTHFF